MRKQNLSKKMALMLLMAALLIVLIIFGGCSSKTKNEIVEKTESDTLIVDEKTVFGDIKQNDKYCSEFDFTYDSMEVIKRMTEEELRTDKVWVNFNCHNDDFEYTVECVVNYVLYNDGWLFEEYSVINSNYTALTKPTEQTVLDDFSHLELKTVEQQENWEQGEDDSYEISNPNACSFIGYAQSVVSEFFAWDITHYINYTFTPEEGWSGRGVHEESSENWNWNAFLGKWGFSKDTVHDIYSIDISQINSNSVSFEYEDYHIDARSGVFEMDYVTGKEDRPKDFPVYSVWIRGDSPASIGSQINFTPYGIYEAVYHWEEDSEPYFKGQFQKMS